LCEACGLTPLATIMLAHYRRLAGDIAEPIEYRRDSPRWQSPNATKTGIASIWVAKIADMVFRDFA
jgi:hypothetical protein